jgi:O-antigen biosynthesis protein
MSNVRQLLKRAIALLRRAVALLRREGPIAVVRKALRISAGPGAVAPKVAQDVAVIRSKGVFDRQYYFAQVPELETNGQDPIRHYVEHGAALRLNPHPLFDTAFYLDTYPDIAASGDNPLAHYLLHGGFEGRNPGPNFDSAFYSDKYPDVARAHVNPLEHYIGWGEKEGRSPNGIVYLPTDPRGYTSWVELYDTLSDTDREAIRAHIARLPRRPRFSILMPVYNAPEPWLRAAIRSVREQLYPDWQLCIGDDGSTAPHVKPILDEAARADARIAVVHSAKNGGISAATNAALALAQHEYTCFLDHDDVLSPHALYMVACELIAHPGAELVYSDEDKIDTAGVRKDPYFKPDWDPELMLAENFVSHLSTVRTDRLRELGGLRSAFDGSQDHDLVLRLSEQVPAEAIRHIPHVLYHWRIIPGSTAHGAEQKPETSDRARAAIREHLQRRGIRADVVAGKIPERTRVVYALPEPPPRVTMIIPTKDHTHLLQALIRSLDKTDYPDLELVIVSNNTSAPEALRYLAKLKQDPRVKFVSYPHQYNFSSINNLGVRNATGSVLALLNDDVEGLHPDWLKDMVGYALQPDVGIVGCKLYYPDWRIQHAGVILGIGGIAGHLHKYMPRDWPGRMGHRAIVAQSLSAVTAACVVLRKELYVEAGGLDEAIGVNFNDVDLCIRVRDLGYRNVYTPYAELLHKESATRGLNETPEKQTIFEREIKLMRSRWGDALLNDPYYNPNLSLRSENEALAIPPRAVKPWLRTSG